jgi:hypothetical protein
MMIKWLWDLRPIGESITALERKVAALTRRLDEQPAPTDPEARLAQAEADIADLKAIVQQHWAEIQQAAKKGGDVEVKVGSNWGHGHGATGKIL